MNIQAALRLFLARETERAPEQADETELIIGNLVEFLEGYGYRYVEDETGEFGAESGEGFDEIEESFAGANTPQMIPAAMPEFLYYWQIRKVSDEPDEARATGLLIERLLLWLAEEGLANPNAASEMAILAHKASDEVARANGLSNLLYDLAKATSADAPSAGDDSIDAYLRIVRLEPARMWLEQEVGPIDIPAEASAMAEVGWWINVVVTPGGSGWIINEVGYVYPMMIDDGLAEDEADGEWEILFDRNAT